MSSQPEPSPDEIRLGELVDRFQQLRERDASVGIGSMKEEAGELFPELAELAECLGVLRAGFGADEEEIPVRIGEYRILARIGAGMSSVVYKAERDGQPVALKVMRESLTLSSDAVQRFKREFEEASRLDHPNIVRVRDHGQAEGKLYFAMDLVEGASLADVLSRIESACGPAPDEDWLAILDEYGIPDPRGPTRTAAERYARRVCALFAPMANALAHAHEAGLIHRDLKPANIYIGPEGQAQIGDFGLAKIVGAEITSTVAILGSPGFMSPEQASGASRLVDPRTDIYGLGASLYRALTLLLPVEADSFGEILAAILSKRPEPISKISADYPRGLEQVVSRCLEKEREDRYPTAMALARDLERVSTGKRPRIGRVSTTRRAVRQVKRHPLRFAATGVILAVLATGALIWWTRPAHLTVAVHPPQARILLDDRALTGPNWSGEIDRGDHRLHVSLDDRFTDFEERFHLGPGGRQGFTIHLWPKDPFDPETLPDLAEAYDASLHFPVLMRPRGISDEPIGRALEPSRPSAFADRLDSFDPEVRDRPYIHLFVIARLLDEELYAEAYAAAMALAERYPDRKTPLRFALEALRRLKLDDRALYRNVFSRMQELSDD